MTIDILGVVWTAGCDAEGEGFLVIAIPPLMLLPMAFPHFSGLH